MTLINVTCLYVWIWRRYRLTNGFIDHLYIPLGTTSNDNATANLRILQITTAPAKNFVACRDFISHSPVTVSNSGVSSACRAQTLIFNASRAELLSEPTADNSKMQSQSRSYFTIGGLPPISLSWRQVPCGRRPETFSNWTLAVIVLM
jgi:hypothetical protein